MHIGISSIGRFYMFDLARQMVRLGQQVDLYTGYPLFKVDKDLRPITHSRWFWTVAHHVRKRIGPPPRTTWWADRAFEDFDAWLARNIAKVDILDALAGTAWQTGRVLARRGTPWICNRGSTHILTQKELLEEEHNRWNLPAPYFDTGRPMDRALGEYAEADAIVVPSNFAKRSFVAHGLSANKVYVCPYGVELSLFRPLSKKDDRFRVLFVGTFSARKGIGYLLDAARPLVEQGLIELWLIGAPDATGREILRRYAGLFIDKGFQPRSQLAWHYSQGSVLVLPSIEEGLALVQAQAMACGLPVIATPNTGAEDLFTDGVEGFIIPIRSPEAIQERLLWLLDNPNEREAMATSALQRVKGLGGWDTYGERCLAMYQTVVKQKQKYGVE